MTNKATQAQTDAPQGKAHGQSLDLALFIGSLEGGGAQRIACLLANAWVEAGHNVTVYHNDHVNDFFPFTQAEAIKMCRLPMNLPVESRWKARVRLIKDVLILRKNILAADHYVIISFLPQANVLTLLACVGTKVPVIIAELCHPEHEFIGRYWSLLRKWTYAWASVFIVQTTDIHDWFHRNIGLSATIVPNPVPKPEAERGERSSTDRKVIMAAARLTYQKNLTSLASAFARLADKHPEWDLDIYGLGEELEQIEAIINENGLQGRIRLPGWTSKLSHCLAQSEMFVLSSRFEGMPMALAEAMSMGVPCVSTDCPSGPADYIVSGENGLLVPVEDVDALVDAMDVLMSDEQYRARLGEKAKEVFKRFSPEVIIAIWDQCIRDARGKK